MAPIRRDDLAQAAGERRTGRAPKLRITTTFKKAVVATVREEARRRLSRSDATPSSVGAHGEAILANLAGANKMAQDVCGEPKVGAGWLDEPEIGARKSGGDINQVAGSSAARCDVVLGERKVLEVAPGADGGATDDHEVAGPGAARHDAILGGGEEPEEATGADGAASDVLEAAGSDAARRDAILGGGKKLDEAAGSGAARRDAVEDAGREEPEEAADVDGLITGVTRPKVSDSEAQELVGVAAATAASSFTPSGLAVAGADLPPWHLSPEAAAVEFIVVKNRDGVERVAAAIKLRGNLKLRVHSDVPLGQARAMWSELLRVGVREEHVEEFGMLAVKMEQASFLGNVIAQAEVRLNQLKSLWANPWLPPGPLVP